MSDAGEPRLAPLLKVGFCISREDGGGDQQAGSGWEAPPAVMFELRRRLKLPVRDAVAEDRLLPPKYEPGLPLRSGENSGELLLAADEKVEAPASAKAVDKDGLLCEYCRPGCKSFALPSWLRFSFMSLVDGETWRGVALARFESDALDSKVGAAVAASASWFACRDPFRLRLFFCLNFSSQLDVSIGTWPS